MSDIGHVRFSQTRDGFSIIELIVVIAIIAILAAIAIPAYRTYSVRAKIGMTMVMAENALKTAAKTYSLKGTFDSSVPFGNATFTAGGGSIAITNVSGVISGGYYRAPDLKGASIAVNYATMAGITQDVNSTIYYSLRDINGVLTFACGGNGGSNDGAVPVDLRPANCTCAFIGHGWPTSGFTSTGSGC